MKRRFLLPALCWALPLAAMAGWTPVGERIRTVWADSVSPQDVRPEYPRPIMQRDRWMNLNGLWQYAVTPRGARCPQEYEGEILVPFAIESSLSGVGRHVGDNEELWYRLSFEVPATWRDKDVMLNFGAVDWQCDVWVNGIKVGSHAGGYTPFAVNLTAALKARGVNELTVRVWDPCDHGFQPRGKQTSNPGGIWYTPVTGIWQTVWLEPVSPVHITSLRTTPDIDRGTLTVAVAHSGPGERGIVARVTVKDAGGQVVASGAAANGEPVCLAMPDGVRLWSPGSPYLYDMEVTLLDGGKEVDGVRSYAAMRKFSTRRDADGIVRMQLNNEDIFHFGPLDQGWWPDGLYTAPTHSAMVYDIDMTRELGFNMIRKHVKVEPATWYTHCDRVGIIVWQDMPSGDRGPEWQSRQYFTGSEMKRSAQSEANYRREWQEIMDYLYSYPCIGVWVPFNEAWGQFKCEEIAQWTKEHDPSRLVNPASGGNFYHTGDILDLHNYPGPAMYLYDGGRANVLGEYGGIGYAVPGHLWAPDRNWGYVEFKSSAEVTDQYERYARELLGFARHGFTGAVYTQTTDVECEVNGLMTYDRRVVKMDMERVRAVNRALIGWKGE